MATLALSANVFAAPKGNPFQEIKASIDELSQQLESLSAIVDEQLTTAVPVDVAVDCNAGESISDVLTEYNTATAPLTINISGVCNEVAAVLRGNVTLQGVTGDAGIHSDSPTFGSVTVSRGARNVRVFNLALTGGQYGVLVVKNSQVLVSDVNIHQTVTGLVAVDNSMVDLTASNVHDSNSGVIASLGGTINLSNTIIENNSGFGVVAMSNGLANLRSVAPDGSETDGVTLRYNGNGVVAQDGGRALIADAQIEFSGFGVFVRTQASVTFNGDNVINGHATAGVFAQRNTSVVFNPGNHTISNNGFGVNCSADTAYLAAAVPTFINNGFGDIVGCTGP
ncbi:MAG: hypothetical protein WDZ30_07510 [Cellvibrionaceae bacterium]